MPDTTTAQQRESFPLDWPRAYGEPALSGTIRTVPEDFRVDEILGFEPDGDGSHALLKIRKKNINTERVAKQLARFAGVRQVDVGYAGLKDRRAVTTQWFSVDLAGREEPDWQSLAEDGVEFIAVTRHRRKLKRGALQGNYFTLVIREIQGEPRLFEERIAEVSANGVPNYFGEQRFGFANLEKATAMFTGQLKRVRRPEKSIYLSAARSWLFNKILAARVAAGSWNRAIAGDVMMLAGSHSIFSIDGVDNEIDQRIQKLDIHPTGAMWGGGELAATRDAELLETAAVKDEVVFCAGLKRAGLKQQRRALRLMPVAMQFNRTTSNAIELQFSLPAGSYATVVLRELLNYRLHG